MKKMIFLVGILLCFYPLISNMTQGRHQKDAVATYQEEVAHSEQEKLEQCLKEAEHYNELLYRERSMGISSMETYWNQLKMAENDVIGSIEIPKITVNLPIYHGTEESVLAAGAGHLQESSLPVGGKNTHSVLTGHRGLPDAKLFTRLDELEKQDLFYIYVCGKKLAYRVTEIEVVCPEDKSVLEIEPEKDLVSLVTCTPYGVNTHRLVVTGERVAYQEEEYANCQAQMMSWREILFSALPFLFIAAAVVKLIKVRRNAHEKAKN